jgi:S-adenosylmethionine hydrolase
MRAVVALLTDYGTQDHYVGAVKGAILAADPDASVVDIVHDLPPHDIQVAAFALDASYRAFPAGSVFLAVVDPGVGSERRALALEAGGYRFVGPDNGLFTLVLAEHADARVHEITNAGLFRHEVSPTFHGRDVFAPVAGRLAGGMALAEVGPKVADPVLFAVEGCHAVGKDAWESPVIHVDRFGNLVTAFSALDLEEILAGVGGDPNQVLVTVEGIAMPLVQTFADVAEGEPCAYFGSSRRLEIALNRGNASRVLGAARGAPVRIRRH